jgi:hypothetical protein
MAMLLGQPSVELCAPSTSNKVATTSRINRRPRVICGAQRGQNGNHTSHVVGKATAGRAGLQRSKAVAAPVREEVSPKICLFPKHIGLTAALMY